jgi:N-ethylmaleimide reductase
MTTDLLFSPFSLGKVPLKNRVVMAPMTRNRSNNGVPGDLVVEYYRQRAEAGLIITEGTAPSPNGQGYARIPGLYNQEQVAAWKRVTQAVHREGGHIVVQLMHTGRASHPDNLPKGARHLAPSAVAGSDPVWVDPDGPKAAPAPTAMTAQDIESTIEEYAVSAHLAIEAGFDGVELHGANGYLIEEFLNPASNLRTDDWGGSPDKRMRFGVEVSKRVADRIGSERLGIRVSPFGTFGGMTSDDTTEGQHESFARAMSELGLLYMHIVDHQAMGAPAVPASVKQKIRDAFNGKLILSGGYDHARAEVDLKEHRGDLIAFGRPFISNPRLVTRLKAGAELRPAEFSTFYTPGGKGYTDYPRD